MTTINLSHDVLDCIKVNGRVVAFNPRTSEVPAGRWEGLAAGERFVIIGGRESGGAANEWFVQWDVHGEHMIPVKSAAQAVRTIEFA